MDVIKRKTLFSFGPGTAFPHEWSWMLDMPGRSLILSPATVASRLPLREDARVLEVGAGTGYYAQAVAPRVPKGRLELFDLQAGMLDKARRRLARHDNVGFTRGEAGSDLPFEDASFDVVYLVTVFGEIPNQDRFLASAERVVKPGGTLSFSEHHPDPDFESAESITKKVERYGFRQSAHKGWRWAFTVDFVRC